jgi:hypothetical protein
VKSTHLAILLQQHLVIFAQGDAEDDGRDVLEAVYPLLALASLAADVKHAAHGQKSLAASRLAHCMLSWPMVNRVS